MKISKISSAWTAEERIAVATVFLGAIQLDIPAGRYSEIGRPNVTSVLYVLHLDVETLEQSRRECEEMIAKLEAESNERVHQGILGYIPESEN